MTHPFIVMIDLDGPFCTSRAKDGLGSPFDPVAGGMLAKLCAQTGARIVIISDRRRDDGLKADLDRIGLADHLFDHPDHWRTGHDPQGIRGNEVDAWHDANPGHDYALIDDVQAGYAPHHLMRLVHTDAHAGLSMADLGRLRRLMGVGGPDAAANAPTTPRNTLARTALDAIAAIDQGDDDRARALLAIIAGHPLAH